MLRRSRWISPLFLFLLPAIPLWRALFLGLTIGPFDQIRQMAPWHGPAPSEPWDVLQADGVLQFFPWRDLVFDAWSKRQLPLWNNYELAGTPLLANSQSAGFYPPHILLGLLHVPTATAIVILAWFHLFVAGFGAYALSRTLGASKIGALVAGASFELSPFMLSWTALASVISTVAWIPWMLAAALSLFGKVGEAADRRTVTAPFLVVALCTGMLILAGHLQFAFYGLFGTVLVTAVALASRAAGSWKKSFISAGVCAAALVLGLMLAACQLLPVLQYGKLSNRQNTPTEEGYSAYVASAIKPFELANLAEPYALGDPRAALEGPTTGSARTTPSGISTYWPPLLKPGANFAESALTIGPLTLCLLACASWKDRRLWPIQILGVMALLLCAGTALNRVLYFGIPGWSATGSPGRITALFVLSACVVAGCSLERLIEFNGRRRLASIVGGLLLGFLLVASAPSLAPAPAQNIAKSLEAIQSVAAAQALPVLLLTSLLAVVGLAPYLKPNWARLRVLLALLPAVLAGASGGLQWITTGKPLDPVANPAGMQRIAYLNSGWSLLRAAKANMPPNTASLSRIHELGGYDSLVSAETVSMLRAANGEDPAPPTNGNMMFIKKGDPARLAAAGVSFVDDGSGPRAIQGPSRCSLEGGTATIASEDYSNVVITAHGSGLLTLRDRLLPGWTASVDGAKTPLETGTWRIVNLGTPGDHTVTFTYEPPGLKQGLAVSLAGLVLLLIALFAGIIGVGRKPVWEKSPSKHEE